MKRIIDLKNVTYSMPDAFTDIAKVKRSHISVVNVPVRLKAPNKGHNVTKRDAATTLNGSVIEVVAP